MLNISFLGKSKIDYNGNGLEDQLGNKAIALICLLILNEKRYLSREKIVGYLWPDSNIEAAKYNLRYNLWLIKKNIGEDAKNQLFLKVDNDCCCINREYEFECDVLNIMNFRPSQQDSVESILNFKKLFRGDLLEGCYFNKCDEFNDFIIYERINFEQRKVKILKRLVELYENENKYDNCIDIICEILEIDPYDEYMVLKLLDIYVKVGKRAAAITYFNNFSNKLACSLGIAPSKELRNKYDDLRLTLSENKGDSNKTGYKENISKLMSEKNRFLDLKIITACMKNVEYFWIADVVGKIVDVADEESIKKLTSKELMDLGFIQSSILKFSMEQWDGDREYKREIMGVCIVNAFIKLLTIICNKGMLTIVILDSESMDEISANVLNYLKKIKMKNLVFIEE